MLTHRDCCIIEEKGEPEHRYVEVTTGAYSLPQGKNTTEWVLAGRFPRGFPGPMGAETKTGLSYAITPDFVNDRLHNIAFCIILLASPVRAPPRRPHLQILAYLARGEFSKVFKIDGCSKVCFNL